MAYWKVSRQCRAQLGHEEHLRGCYQEAWFRELFGTHSGTWTDWQNFEDLLDQERDAGLGNGGLGRLAACYVSWRKPHVCSSDDLDRQYGYYEYSWMGLRSAM